MFKLFEKIKRCQKGSVVVAFAVSLPTTLLAMGAAIDYSIGVQTKTKLQRIVDSATLTAARLDRIGNQGRRKQFREEINAMLGDAGQDITITKTIFDVERSRHKIEFKATVTAQISTHVMGMIGMNTMDIEVTSKAMEEIRPVEVALVLDVSSSMRSRGRIDKLKRATNAFLDEAMFTDGERDELVTVSIVPYGGTVRLPEELWDEITVEGNSDHWEGGTWNGCLQYSEDDFNDSDIEDESFEMISHFWRWNNGNWWCPESELVPQTKNVEALRDAVENFTLSDGTGTDHGVLWGLKMLSPDWQGELDGTAASVPAPYESRALKIMVVMTDGGITEQMKPNSSELANGTPAFRTTGGTRQVIYNRSKAQENFHRVCEYAKSQNIRVYTVGVEINSNWALQDLKDCATTETAHYFDVNGNALLETFKTIASSIKTPRVVE